MLNKYLFGLLVNTIAIFASISGDVVATEDLHDFRSELNQIAWEGQCSFREICIARHSDSVGKESEKKNAWILDQEYEESRTKVIGEAIGDCIAGKNEFAKKGPNDIITFDETEPKDYEPEHWNAVILYNYIHEAINGELKSTKVAEVLKKKLEKTAFPRELDDWTRYSEVTATLIPVPAALRNQEVIVRSILC